MPDLRCNWPLKGACRRYSGTEAVVRIMVEGEEQGMVEKIAHELADVLREEIGMGDIAHEIADVLKEDMGKP